MEQIGRLFFRRETPIFRQLIERCIEILPDDRPTSEELESTMLLFTQAFYESVIKKKGEFLMLPTKEKDEIFLQFYSKFYLIAEEYLKNRFPSDLFGCSGPPTSKPKDEEPVQCPIQ